MPKRGSVGDLANLAMFERDIVGSGAILSSEQEGAVFATLDSPTRRTFLRKTTE